jgi:hypothetical protein
MSLVSLEENVTIFGVAGAMERDRRGANTSSALSGVAFEKARRRSVNGENIRACMLLLDRLKLVTDMDAHRSELACRMAATNQPFEFATENNCPFPGRG